MKGTAEDEMVGWHHWLDGHEFEQVPEVDDGQGNLACCSPWGHKESDTTELLNWTDFDIEQLMSVLPWVQLYLKPQRIARVLKKAIKQIIYYSDCCINFHLLKLIFALLLEGLVGSYDTACCINLFGSGSLKTLIEPLLQHRNLNYKLLWSVAKKKATYYW